MPTIGQLLKKAREERYLTIEKASEETRIRPNFLRALEADDFSAMPSAAQGRGFLRNYAAYLGINIDEVIAEMQKNAPLPEEISGPLPQVNLQENQLPPLSAADEKTIKPPPFWKSWLARKPRAESTLEDDSQLSEAESPLEAQEQIQGPEEEAQEAVAPVFWERIRSILKFSKKIESEIEEGSGDVVEEETPISQPVSTETPEAIYAEIGRALRERREVISLTIEEVERHTHLRTFFVKALEEGAFEKLPSPVQTRGMIANYASFLGMDADVILLRFADALQARHRSKYAPVSREQIQTEVKTSIPLFRMFIAGDLVFGLAMIAGILGLALWGISRVLLADVNPAETPSGPSIVDVLAATDPPDPQATQNFIPVDETLAPTSDAPLPTAQIATLSLNANVTVSIFAVERTFVRISVDGAVAFEGRMAPRETKIFEADNQVEVLTGNAGALRITYNGRDLGLMGAAGEVASRVYLISGIATPTATIQPTATNTAPVTPTQTPSATFTPSPGN